MHYNGANGYFFVNGSEIYKSKATDSEIVATPVCLRNISKDWSTDNMKKTGFYSYVYDFSVDYDAIDVDDIRDIHNYLVKKSNILHLLLKVFYIRSLCLSCKKLIIGNRCSETNRC